MQNRKSLHRATSVKIVLANDTSGTSNPGCQGTTAMLRNLIGSDVDIISRLPVSYHYHQPPPPAAPIPSLAQRGINKLSRIFANTPSTLDPDHAEREWRSMLPGLTARLEPLWKEAEMLVVNAEGTIHHNAAGAKTLIALCAVAHSMGMRTALVNGSIFKLDSWLLKALKKNVDTLSVREPVSLRYLQENGINAQQAADCLFLSHHIPRDVAPALKSPYAIYTPGVLSGSGAVSEEAITKDIRAIAATGREVFYYVIESEDEPLARAAAHAGAKIISLGRFQWEEITPFFSAADLIVSGRYHINIYAALAGTPFVPMETNTSKITGLLELLQAPVDFPVRAWKNNTGKPDPLDLEAVIHTSPETLDRCAALAGKTRNHLFPAQPQ